MDEQLLRIVHELVELLRVSLARPAPPPPASAPEVSLTAGPFADNDEVRRFAEELAAMGLVSEVRLQGYEGEDRALLDVRLAPPSA